MNYSAYLATGKMIALMQSLSKINVRVHNKESVPKGSIIFVVNHFTRIETLLLPYHIYINTHVPVWSLADQSLFEGPLSGILGKVGAVSTRNPDRDRLIVKSLLTGEANWIIFPEGRMVKDKETASNHTFFNLHHDKRKSTHTGAATLALRAEFYRKRLRHLRVENPAEAERLQKMFEIDELAPVLAGKTWIVPINLTYYPLRARENVLSTLANRFAGGLSERLREELLTEGTMFFDGVDIDIRFGQAIPASESLATSRIRQDIFSLRQINFDDRLPSLPAMRFEATALMKRFMSAIYRMTTVNHDHLFSSLLKALPFSTISEEDFRRRVFLLTDLVPDKTLVFCHQSLETPQVALLTDDRYHKYRDFLELARETGIVHHRKGFLVKFSANFSADSEFQRIRIDNPLRVAANEVQPLTWLKRQVRLLAWLPEILIRHRVVDVLLRQVAAQYEADYSRFYRAGESKERTVGAPLLLKGTSRRVGIVLVHGFLAAPREMLELAAHLNGKGYWVYCVRLRGHGTASGDLAIRGGDDWIESADIGYALMSSICRRVVMGGFSFGGGLALGCAARIPHLAGVFAVSPPFQLRNVAARFAGAVTSWNKFMDAVQLSGVTKEYIDSIPERPLINYTRIPVAALLALELYMKALEPRLKGISVPTLMIQGLRDPLVNDEATEYLFNDIGTKQKKYVTYDLGRHGILAGDGSGQVHETIAGFIDML
jgi:esterase/lipase/1-acyl-sn-glycerol-3-phosphate acyltransferase